MKSAIVIMQAASAPSGSSPMPPVASRQAAIWAAAGRAVKAAAS